MLHGAGEIECRWLGMTLARAARIERPRAGAEGCGAVAGATAEQGHRSEPAPGPSSLAVVSEKSPLPV